MKTIPNYQQEITPLDKEDFFIILNRPNAKFDYALHWHTDFEINLVIGSYGERIVGDSKEDFSDLDVVLVGPRLSHIWSGAIEKGNHVITIQFHEQTLEYPLLHKRIFLPILSLLEKAGRGIVFEGEAKEVIKDRILELAQTEGIESSNGFFSLLDYMSKTDEKRLLASQSYQTDFLSNNTHSRRISMVAKYVDKHYKNEVTLSDVAKLTNMSETAFCHFFKKKTGKNFIDFLNDVRIGHASKMLYETTNTISEICFESGFNNTVNFIRAFKKKHGKTPSEYRGEMKKFFSKF